MSTSKATATIVMKSKRAFTLLEIMVCIAILSLVAGFLGWHVKSMVDVHRFHKHIDRLVTDLHKLQIIALTHETDITLNIQRNADGKLGYLVLSDEPGAIARSSFVLLSSVEALTLDRRHVEKMTLHITPDGSIRGAETLGFFQNADNKDGLILDLSKAPKISSFPGEEYFR